MRDGVVLRADAYLPDDDTPVPAVVSRTPYDRSFPPAAEGFGTSIVEPQFGE